MKYLDTKVERVYEFVISTIPGEGDVKPKKELQVLKSYLQIYW